MADIKSKAQDIDPNANPKNIKAFVKSTGNIYESLAIISKRANVLNNLLREELHSKLEEFADVSDSIEEIEENKEQVEISKFYERLPNLALIATDEFLNGQLDYRYQEEEKEDE
jgi:DNA-directed RNA polymerase subunit K/omega